MDKWLSSSAPVQGVGFRQFGSWAWTWHCSLGNAEAASHMPQLEGSTTKKYTTMYWGRFGGGKEDWHQLLAQMPIFNKKKKKSTLCKLYLRKTFFPVCPSLFCLTSFWFTEVLSCMWPNYLYFCFVISSTAFLLESSFPHKHSSFFCCWGRLALS